MRLQYFALLFLTSASYADDVKSALERSSFAGVVTIVAGNQIPYKDSEYSNCGSGYTAYTGAKRVFVNNIGWVEGSPLEFRAGSTLELGGSYLVFLNNVTIEKYTGPIGRNVRTSHCMKGGISLVPVLIETPSISVEAVFQEWRLDESAATGDAIQHTDYFLAHSELREFFRSSRNTDGKLLEPISLEIQRFYGLTRPDAYVSDDVLKLVADSGCGLRERRNEPMNNLRIAKCEP